MAPNLHNLKAKKKEPLSLKVHRLLVLISHFIQLLHGGIEFFLDFCIFCLSTFQFLCKKKAMKKCETKLRETLTPEITSAQINKVLVEALQ